MATLRKKGPVYDVRPAGEYSPYFKGPVGGPIGMMKDAIQGAGSGLLAFFGAMQMHASGLQFGAGGPLLATEFGSIEAIVQSVAAGGAAGPLQLLGAIALFMAAKRTISRTCGLMVFVGVLAAYANGYSLQEMLGVAEGLLQSLSALGAAIPETASGV